MQMFCLQDGECNSHSFSCGLPVNFPLTVEHRGTGAVIEGRTNPANTPVARWFMSTLTATSPRMLGDRNGDTLENFILQSYSVRHEESQMMGECPVKYNKQTLSKSEKSIKTRVVWEPAMAKRSLKTPNNWIQHGIPEQKVKISQS